MTIKFSFKVLQEFQSSLLELKKKKLHRGNGTSHAWESEV